MDVSVKRQVFGTNRTCFICPNRATETIYRAAKNGSADLSSGRPICSNHSEQAEAK